MSASVCSFYVKGKCNRGEQCAFRHTSTATPSPRRSTVPRAPIGVSTTQFGPLLLKIPCKYYQRGACSNPSCRFLHIDTPTPPKSLTFSPVGEVSNPPHAGVENTPTCLYFGRGSCKFGDECRHYHDKSSRTHVSPKAPRANSLDLKFKSLELSADSSNEVRIQKHS